MRFTIGLLICALLANAAIVGAAAASNEEPSSVADLRYGTALYAYYQGNYRDALTELMLAQSRGGIEGHGERPKIMEGAFALTYGLDCRAAQVFNAVLGNTTDPEVRDAAWFYLARMRYRKHDWQGAGEALAKISQEPPEAFAEDLLALRINLAIQRGELDRAHRLIEDEKPDATWLPYLYYNLGAAHSRAGNYAAALPYYNKLAEIPLYTEEQRTLYDRAMTAAGYSLLHSGEFSRARAQFSRVRLDSPLSGSALLGYGWAAAQQNDYVEALTPWTRLAERSLTDANSQEALVAVPYAYEQLGNKHMALREFREAQQQLSRELEVVEGVLAELKDETLIQALEVDPDASFNWLEHSAEEQLEPQLAYLAELFSRNNFQGRLQEMRDLVALRRDLREWQQKLDLYSGMLDEREASRSERLTELEQQNVLEQIDQLNARRDRLADELDRVQDERDYLALVRGEQADLADRLQAIERNLALLDKKRNLDDERSAYRRYRGLLLWQASEDYAGRVWQVRKQLAALDEALKEAADTRRRLGQLVETAADLEPYRARIGRSQERVATQLVAIDEAIGELQAVVRSDILAVLQEQQQRLRYYLAQARLAVARLYDSAPTAPAEQDVDGGAPE